MTNLIPRAAIGLVPAKPNSARFINPDRITAHYGGVDPLLRTEEDLFRLMRQVQYQDMVNKGYSDIMYSLAANPFRPVPLELRGLAVRGAANGTTTANTISPSVLFPFGPSLSGIAHIPNWQENIIESARIADDIIEWTFGKAMPWVGHRDWKATACPGDWMYQMVKSAFDERPAPAPIPIWVADPDHSRWPIVGFNYMTRDPYGQDGYVHFFQDFLNKTSPEGCPVDGVWGPISSDRLFKFQGYFAAQGYPCRPTGITDQNTCATIKWIGTVEGIL